MNRHNSSDWLPALATTFLVSLQASITNEVTTAQGRHKLQKKDAVPANGADPFLDLVHFHAGSQSETKFKSMY